jgi:hypothetical protein
VVETGGLENRLALTGYGGSNPSPSAKYSFKDIPLTDTEIRRSKVKEESCNLVDGQGLHLTVTP